MTLIDQRILIDAPQEIVWDFVANPDKIARWHTGYTSISVLTTQYMGIGTRRRCALSDGSKDIIEEITAVVNGIGYEYVIIEGSPYRAFLARIRLQASPDGTSVQWTIDYTPKGLFGQIKNRLGNKKRIADMVATSLRQLRQQVDAFGVRMDQDYRERVGIRGRLDFNERAQYQPRHAPPPDTEPIEPAAPPAETFEQDIPAAIDEPVEAEPAVEPSGPSTPPSGIVPSFVTELIEDEGEPDYSHKADTKPRPPEGLREAIAAQQAAQQAPTPLITEQDTIDLPEPPVVAPPAAIQPPPVPVQIPTPTFQPPVVDPKRPTPPRGIPAVDRPTPDPISSRPTAPNVRDSGEFDAIDRRPNLPPQTPMTDTGEISIWEVFGLKRPSDEDSQSLEELVQTVREREQIERVRHITEHKLIRTSAAHPTRLRVRVRAQTFGRTIGLRLQLALRAAGVRLRKPFC